MEEVQTEKKEKPVKPSRITTLKIKKETKKKIQTELARVNRKEHGRPLHVDDLVAFAVSLVTPEHIEKLQESTLSNADRLERDYRAYTAQIGPMSKDEYLGKRLNGEIEGKK